MHVIRSPSRYTLYYQNHCCNVLIPQTYHEVLRSIYQYSSSNNSSSNSDKIVLFFGGETIHHNHYPFQLYIIDVIVLQLQFVNKMEMPPW
jgi:hypothetical protein